MADTLPYYYQWKGARDIHKLKGRALVAYDPGLGKSLCSLLYYKNHIEDIGHAVVVCPASLKYNWEAEALKHFGMRCEVLSGTVPDKRVPISRPQLTVVNYDILGPWVKYIQAAKPGLVIIDECSALQGRHTKRLRAVRALCHGIPRVVALSGTPITNRPAELWPTLNLLRPDLWPSFVTYAKAHCSPKLRPWGWDYSGASRLQELHELLLRHTMLRCRKADVLGQLPPKRRIVTPLPISDEAQYRAAERDFLVWLAKTQPERLHSAMKAERLTQIGYLKRLVGKLKLPAVLDWADNFLSNSEGKLILFAVHHDILDALQVRYGRCAVRVDGTTPAKKRQDAVDLFQRSEKIRVFLGNIESAGKGLTLTAASTVAFVELDWRPATHSQAGDRVHRISQEQDCDIYWLIAHGTIDDMLCQILQKKQGVLDAVMDGGTIEGEGLSVHDELIEAMRRQNDG